MQDEFLKYAHLVNGRANALAEDMVRELRDARAEIMGKIAELNVKMLKGELAEASYAKRRKYFTRLKAELEKMIAGVYQTNGTLLIDAATDVYEGTRQHAARTMNRAVGVNVGLPKLEQATVQAWFETATIDGLVLNEWMQKLERNAVDRIVSATRQAMLQNMETQQAARHMRQKGIEGSVPGLQRLARTGMLSTMNHAKETTIEEHFSEELHGWRYVGTLDGRTCPICGPDDGKIFRTDQNRPNLPRHFGCRCTYVPVASPKQGMPERPSVKHSGRTVHHRDGSTSTKFTVEDATPFRGTYEQWLRRMLNDDPYFVKSILGKSLFELYRSGRIRLDSMVTYNRIKRISELQS